MQSESIYLNPLTDYGFKFLFGTEQNKDFLISFLNALFPEEGQILEIAFINKEHIKENPDSRSLIYDIHCTTDTGKKYIVEMQNRYQSYFKDRALFYTAFDICRQGQTGRTWDHNLVPVYGVFIMNFEWRDALKSQLREDVMLMNIQTHEIFSDKLRMVFLKLPLLDKDAESCSEILDRWLYLLKNMESMERIPESFAQVPVFRKLGSVARVAMLSANERFEYDRSLKAYRDYNAVMGTERAEGRAEGIEIGKLNERRAVMSNLFKAGFTVDEISKITGWSKQELSDLQLD